MDAQQILKDTFGYDAFRPGQERLIKAVLSGRDVMGIMPTGAGKSICFQIPSLTFKGLTLVISPLVSLMLDQVLSLKEYGIRAAFLNSSLTPGQQRTVLNRAANHAYQIMYVAPERLASESFRVFCNAYPIPFVAVDEAHCISQWGHAFRPDYMKIKPFIDSLPKRPVVGAYTATATVRVRQDIVSSLGLQDPVIQVNSFDRPNLSFEVQTGDKKNRLTRFLKHRQNDSGIIYCGTRKEVESLCEELGWMGFEATRYHAGLSDKERTENQNDFLYDRKKIMVATNAFGMGIDKSNVSYVVHYNMPKNIESYYQEAGRAGRDGSPADCLLLYSGQDVRLNEFLIRNSLEENKELTDAERAVRMSNELELLKKMTWYATGTECLRVQILRYFGEESAPCGHCGNCLRSYEAVDVTRETQTILNTVGEFQSRRRLFGRITLRDFFRGRNTQQIINKGLVDAPGFGGLSHLSPERILQILDWMTQNQLLRKTDGEYPVLALGPDAPLYMQPSEKPLTARLPLEKEKTEPLTKTDRSVLPPGDGLFEALRQLRKKIADEQHVPAYVVFSDATLMEIARSKPDTFSRFRAIKGVGQVKAVKYSGQFIVCIRDYETEHQ